MFEANGEAVIETPHFEGLEECFDLVEMFPWSRRTERRKTGPAPSASLNTSLPAGPPTVRLRSAGNFRAKDGAKQINVSLASLRRRRVEQRGPRL